MVSETQEFSFRQNACIFANFFGFPFPKDEAKSKRIEPLEAY